MESGFRWTPYDQHLTTEKAMQRHIGRQPKNFQIRYAELNRQLRQAENIINGENWNEFDRFFGDRRKED